MLGILDELDTVDALSLRLADKGLSVIAARRVFRTMKIDHEHWMDMERRHAACRVVHCVRTLKLDLSECT